MVGSGTVFSDRGLVCLKQGATDFRKEEKKMTKFAIAALVAGYFVWACIKKYRDIKRGRLCGCGCEGCKARCNAETPVDGVKTHY